MASGKGLFIVIYGPSGVGKTKQLELLEERLGSERVAYRRVEYPIYDLGEAGPKLKKMLWRQGKALPEEEMQLLFAQNRRDFEPTLRGWLNSGVTVLAEDYKGTGIVWGVTRGLSIQRMEEINKDFGDPDVSILIDGPRRLDLRPGEGHIYQQDEEEWYRARKAYLQMADRYGWIRIGGDAPILTVAGRIWTVVKLALAMKK
jgi:thymidylate kinase